MPTTSSPWASPSSPAGRRLLLSEPVTADAIPVLDDATFALGAALVAASSTPARHRAPARPAAPACRSHRPRRVARPGRVARRGLAAAALALGVLAVGATGGVAHPAPSASASEPAPSGPVALGQAAGAAVQGAEAPSPAAGGQVVVALIEPTEALRGAPVAVADPPLAERLGTLVALAAEDVTAG